MIQPISPEKLRHRITIQQRTDEQDENGYIYEDVFSNIRAFVEPTGGSEFYAAQKVNSEATANVWIRYIPGLKASMRVMFGSRKFDILVPLNYQEANRWIRLICKELV